MSTLHNIITHITSLLYPRECAACGDTLTQGEQFICTACRFRIPVTGFVEQDENPIKERLAALMPIKRASALFYFINNSDWRHLVHDFKFHGRWRYAYNLGVWFGHELLSSGLYDDVELIIPVPLHDRKLLNRGYNQSDHIAYGIASVLGAKVERHALVRTVNNRSQALRSRNERWANVEGIFEVRHPKKLSGRHVMLVDDVITTGATILACYEAMMAACPDIEVSVAALAASQKEFGFDK